MTLFLISYYNSLQVLLYWYTNKVNVIKLVTLYECKMSTLETALDSRVFTGRKPILKFEL